MSKPAGAETLAIGPEQEKELIPDARDYRATYSSLSSFSDFPQKWRGSERIFSGDAPNDDDDFCCFVTGIRISILSFCSHYEPVPGSTPSNPRPSIPAS